MEMEVKEGKFWWWYCRYPYDEGLGLVWIGRFI